MKTQTRLSDSNLVDCPCDTPSPVISGVSVVNPIRVEDLPAQLMILCAKPARNTSSTSNTYSIGYHSGRLYS